MDPTKEASEFRIVHVAETIKGGIATYLKTILPHQVRRYGRENVIVIVPTDQIRELGRCGGRIISFKSDSKRIHNAVRANFSLQHELKNYLPNIIHIHSTFAGLTCRPMLRLLHRRSNIIYCPHGWAFMRHTRIDRAAVLIERALSHACEAIVCVSNHERSVALQNRIPSNKLVVIENGISDKRMYLRNDLNQLWEDGVIRLLFVGRLDRQKGFDILLSALNRICRRVHLHVFGDSVLKDVAKSDIPSNVQLHGWADFDTIEPYLASCDAVVMPSRWEAFGYTALEAMRAGKAVIGSRTGGLAEVVDDGLTGVLVPPEDVEALAETIRRVLLPQLVEMGRRGRQRFLEKYTAERMEAELAALYVKCNNYDPKVK